MDSLPFDTTVGAFPFVSPSTGRAVPLTFRAAVRPQVMASGRAVHSQVIIGEILVAGISDDFAIAIRSGDEAVVGNRGFLIDAWESDHISVSDTGFSCFVL